MLKSKGAVLNLLTTAERLKELEQKVTAGGNLTPEDIAMVKPVTG